MKICSSVGSLTINMYTYKWALALLVVISECQEDPYAGLKAGEDTRATLGWVMRDDTSEEVRFELGHE